MIRRFSWLFGLAVLLVVAALALADAPAIDFNGEHLVYEFGWQSISAATADVRVTTITDGGVPCYKIVMEIRGKSKLDWIWKVRDRIETITTVDSLLCHRFFFKQREGSFHLNTDVRLDPERNLLVSTRTRFRQGETKALSSKRSTADHFDPLSALYYVRRLELKAGEVHTIKAFDGKRTHDLTYTVLAEERIKIGLGEFDAWKIWPRIVRSSGRDAESNVNKVRKAHLWIDKKPPHNVLQVKSEVFVGKVYVELIKIR